MEPDGQDCVAYRDIVGLLEAVWGEGYMSPGGADEIALLLQGVDLRGKEVLDIGCGVGGIDLLLAGPYDAAQVLGIDVDATLVARAVQRAVACGLGDRLAFQTVTPGPLPFADATFDVVFSKDAILHIADKEEFFADVARVLRPGGLFVASDWLRDTDAEPSPAMQAYIAREGLGFGMASLARSCRALQAAGMVAIETLDRNAWYTAVARGEIERLTGPLYAEMAACMGAEALDREIDIWRLMLVVLESGELRPGHIRARKPGCATDGGPKRDQRS